jgi:3-deoxy-D-manno-octulosonic-acid transferase
VRALYSLAWALATPLAVSYLLARSVRQPAYRRHWGERFGWIRRRPSDAPLIWIHAVSVGETRAAQPLVTALERRYPNAEILLTHMTPTGRATGRELFGDRVTQAYLPYDYARAPMRFLRAWRPAFGLLLETELWPNLMAAADACNVPIALVNARLSEKSLRSGLRHRRLIVPAVRRLSRVLAQSEADAQRMARLGRPADAVTGNLKFDNQPAEAGIALGRAWRERLGTRQVLVAASTRDGEETLILQAWKRAVGSATADADTRSLPLLVIVPRHPQRFGDVEALLAGAGLQYRRRAALDDADADWSRCDVLLGDSMGEMYAWYTLADAALIGGSLLPFGSQNLIEACAVGCPVLIGPHDFNFADTAAAAIEAGAAVRVSDADDAVAQALKMLRDPVRRVAVGAAGRRFADSHRGATERTIAALAPLMDRVMAASSSLQTGREPAAGG